MIARRTKIDATIAGTAQAEMIEVLRSVAKSANSMTNLKTAWKTFLAAAQRATPRPDDV